MAQFVKKISIFITLAMFIFIGSSQLALANGEGSEWGINRAFENAKTVAQDKGLVELGVEGYIRLFLNLIFLVLGTIFVSFMVYAGSLWLTAAGNEEKVSKAKKIIFESVIGLVIVIGAYAISQFIIGILVSRELIQ